MGILVTWCHKITACLKSLLLRAVSTLAVDQTTDMTMIRTALKEMFNVMKLIDTKIDGVAEINESRYMLVNSHLKVLDMEVKQLKNARVVKAREIAGLRHQIEDLVQENGRLQMELAGIRVAQMEED